MNQIPLDKSVDKTDKINKTSKSEPTVTFFKGSPPKSNGDQKPSLTVRALVDSEKRSTQDQSSEISLSKNLPMSKLRRSQSFSQPTDFETHISKDHILKPLTPGYISEHNGTVVVVPSLDFDKNELKKIPGVEYYEQRQLYNLIKLSDPSMRVVFVTSRSVDPDIVSYYLNLKPGKTDISDRIKRLWMLSVNDVKPSPLMEKILNDHPSIVPIIKAAAKGDNTKHVGLSLFTGSPMADQLSKVLEAPTLEAEAKSLYWGTKQGSRQIFEAAKVPHPSGVPSSEDRDLINNGFVRSPKDLALGLARRIDSGCTSTKWMVKLNQGFSGKGNATLDLSNVVNRNWRSEFTDKDTRISKISQGIERMLPTMKFSDKTVTWQNIDSKPGFAEQISNLGVIAEQFIEGELPNSPSLQAVIKHDKTGRPVVEVLSTHEQLLDGQVYLGCRFPATDKYRETLLDYGSKIGMELARNGVQGHFAADFMATKDVKSGDWKLNAVEINLRQGGTTHPFATMAILTDGTLGSDGIFRAGNGQEKYYVAEDCLSKKEYKGLKPATVITAVKSQTNQLAKAINWDNDNQSGVVFHLMGPLETYGKIGFTAIANTPKEAEKLSVLTKTFLDRLAMKHKN